MRETIKEILGQIKENSSAVANLADDTDIINEVGLDSLQMVTFMLKVEEALEIEIDFDELDFSMLTSVGSLCDFLANQKVTA